MEYAKYGDTFLVRLDPGDEIISSLKLLCEQEKISLAHVSGLGATKKAEIGAFDMDTKEYFSKTYEGLYEIASLEGNITTKENKPYLHLHMTIGNEKKGECHSGHLNEAVIGVTAEIFVNRLNASVDRVFNEEVGANIIKFH